MAAGRKVAAHFNDAASHKDHGRRIGREEARGKGVTIMDLEEKQELQDSVLTAYHLATLAFERTPVSKFLCTSTDRHWQKGWAPRKPS